MKKNIYLITVLFLSIQFSQASEQNDKSIAIKRCVVVFEDKPGKNISIQDALDTCIEFVDKNKIDFNIKASDATVWIGHSKNGMTLTFYFDYKHRCLSIVIGENKNVVSWQITKILM